MYISATGSFKKNGASLGTGARSKTVPMSTVGSTKADGIIASLGLAWVDGNKLFPITPPDQGSFLEVPLFSMDKYSCERDATEPFRKYLEVRKMCMCHPCASCDVIDQ